MTPTQQLETIKGEFEEKFVQDGWIYFKDCNFEDHIDPQEVWQWFESKLQAVKASTPVDVLCEVDDKGVALIKVEDKIYTIIKGIYLESKSNKLKNKDD